MTLLALLTPTQFLDAQRIHNLTAYLTVSAIHKVSRYNGVSNCAFWYLHCTIHTFLLLLFPPSSLYPPLPLPSPPSLPQCLHERGEANADHTTLLLNCYTKLKAIDELDKFVAVSASITHHRYHW